MIYKITFLLIILTAFITVNASAEENIYHLTVKAEPNIIFIGGAGDYSSGQVVKLEPAPESWQDYKFVGWKIDGRWTVENPPSIRMDASHSVEAIFEKKDNSGAITVDTIPRVVEVTVDGTIYLPDELPLKFTWIKGSQHVISIQASVGKDLQTRQIFDSWKDGNSDIFRKLTVGDETNYVALYKTQYFLKAISQYGIINGGGWQDAGTAHSFELESDVVIDSKDDNIRYVFNSWDKGDYLNSPQNSIDFVGPDTIKANWDTEYKLTLQTNVPDYDLLGGGWYVIGKNVFLIAEQELKSPDSNVNYVFDKWISKGINPVIIPNAQSPSTAITLDKPYTIEAEYKKSYRVNVWTPFGSTVGGGFHPEGEVAEISMTNTEVIVEDKQIRKIFSGWNTDNARTMDLGGPAELDPDGKFIGGENLLVFVDHPLNITANWKTQYYLDVQTDEGKATGSGWYDIGKMARFSMQTPITSTNFWSSYKFDRWIGDYESDSLSDMLIMNTPKTITAEWKEDSSPGIYNTLILGGIAVAGVVTFSKTYNRFSFGKHVKELIDESKPFEKFFSLRNKTNGNQHPSFYSKPKKKKAILNWLLGKN